MWVTFAELSEIVLALHHAAVESSACQSAVEALPHEREATFHIIEGESRRFQVLRTNLGL